MGFSGLMINRSTAPDVGSQLQARPDLSRTNPQAALCTPITQPRQPALRPINVLYLIDLLDLSPGGAEHALSRLTRTLPKDRFGCSVATFAVEGYDQVKTMFPCDVEVFPLTSSFGARAVQV